MSLSKDRFSKKLLAYFDFDCDNCANAVDEGEPFYFNKSRGDEKWCEDCKTEAEDE